MELALRSLHEAAGDEAAALQSLHIARRDRFQWSKADQRKFGQELAKDAVDLIALRRNIGWKEMKWVVRYFYVEEGPRKRAKHDKQRELPVLDLGRHVGASAAVLGIRGRLGRDDAIDQDLDRLPEVNVPQRDFEVHLDRGPDVLLLLLALGAEAELAEDVERVELTPPAAAALQIFEAFLAVLVIGFALLGVAEYLVR